VETPSVRIFDNGFTRRRSRVLEVDLATRQVTFELGTVGGQPLWTKRRGGAQRLANGNLLITEGDRGRIVESTPEGALVWEYLNPQRNDEANKAAQRRKRAAIYRARRLEAELLPWL
jgi:hypothetical protein